MSPIRCQVFGIGAVGLAAVRMLLDGGATITHCYSRSRQIGRDIGELVDRPAVGIRVEAISTFRAARDAADVALFFTTSVLDDLLHEAAECLRVGIDVVTIAEGALFPWPTDRERAARLDAIAREGGATVTSTGINDAVMAHLPLAVAAYMPDVRKISVDCVGNFGRVGPSSISALPFGMPRAEAEQLFAQMLAPGETPHTYSTPVLQAMLSLGELTAKGAPIITLAPVLAQSQLEVPQIGRVILRGQVCGILDTSEVNTVQGVTIAVRLVGKVFEPGDEERQIISIEGGAPTMTIKVGPLPSVESSAAIAVNRIADVIAATPGFRTLEQLPCPRMRVFG